MLSPAWVELESVPLRAILPLRTSTSLKRRSLTLELLASVPSNTIELPVFSPIILSPESVPLESVPSKRIRISFSIPRSIKPSVKRLFPAPSLVATALLSSVTNLSLAWFPDSKNISVDKPSVSNINKSPFCSDINLS